MFELPLNKLTVKDVKNHITNIYNYSNLNRTVHELQTFVHNHLRSEYNIKYFETYSEITDIKGRKSYTYFYNDLPIYDIDFRGIVKGYKFNKDKKIINMAELHYNSFEATSKYNLIKNGYFIDGTDNWYLHRGGNSIKIDEANLLSPFKTALGEFCISTDNESSLVESIISQTVTSKFNKNDVISFIIWSKNNSSNSENQSPYIKFIFYRSGVQVHSEISYLDNYESVTNIWEYHFVSYSLKDNYDQIKIEIVTPDYVKYKYAGIQLFKKSICTYINYNYNGLISNIVKGNIDKTLFYSNLNKIEDVYIKQLSQKKQIYNEKGLIIKEKSNNNAMVEYSYDDKNRVNNYLMKSDNKFIGYSSKYDIATDDINIIKDEFKTERNKTTENYYNKKSKNIIKHIDEKASETNYSYDDYDNILKLQTSVDKQANSVSYMYKENRLIDKLKANNGSNSTFVYDQADRLLSVNQDSGNGFSRYNNVTYQYLNYSEDEIISKKYGGNGDQYIFEYDEYQRIKKVFLKPRFSTLNKVLKCEYFYDARDMIEKIEEFIDDVKISNTFDYDVNNQVIEMKEYRDDVLVYTKKLDYDNNGNIINEIFTDASNKSIAQYDRVDDLSTNDSDIYYSDFKYKNPKILSCFFNEEDYDEDLKDIIYSKNLSSYIISEDGNVYKSIMAPEYGKEDKVIKEGVFNSLVLDDSSEYLGYKFFTGRPRTYDIFKTIVFWFYIDDIPGNYNRYLLSIGETESTNFLGALIGIDGRVTLRVLDFKGTYESKTTSSALKTGWNFFALNYSVTDEKDQGTPRASEYTLYVNDDNPIKISGIRDYERFIHLEEDTLINIGCQRIADEKLKCFKGKITSLIITNDYTLPSISSYKDELFRDIINYKPNILLDEELKTVSASSSTIFNPTSQFGLNYINLNNSLTSYSKLSPYLFEKIHPAKPVFTTNKITKRDAYNALQAKLAYKFGVNDRGTVSMRCYVEEGFNGKQVLIDNVDSRSEKLSLYIDKDNKIVIQIGDYIENTGLFFERNNWNLIGLSWYTVTSAQIENGYKLNYRITYNDFHKDFHKESSYKFLSMTSYIGRSKEGTSPLRGQIEMLAYSSSYLILDTNSNYLDYINIISSTNEFDQLGLLKKNSITRYGKPLISSKYEYFEEPDGDNIRVIPDVKNLRLYYKNKTNDNIVDIQNLYSYGYDAKGNIDKVSIDGTLKFRYSYDSLSRLKEESYTQQSEPDIVYTYDSNGNIKSKDYKNKGYSHEYKYSFNAKDILNSINKVTIEDDIVKTEVIKSFEYYDTLYTNPTFCGTGTGEDKKGVFYTWEGRRLVNYYDNISFTNIEYKYDSQSRRTAKTVTDKSNKDDVKISEVIYSYDGDKLLSEIDIINNKSKYFTYDENGKLISIRYNGRSYYYMRELTGNIIGIVDDSGVVVVRYEYDAYGNILSVNDTSNINIGNENPFKYKGYYYDIETSMYYCKTRYYVPEWCRWLSADDVSYLDPSSVNGLNLYAYCGNNPVMFVDPSGCLPIWAKWVIGGVIIVGAAALTVVTAGGFAAAGTAVLSVFTATMAPTAASAVFAGAFVGSLAIGTAGMIIAGSSSEDGWSWDKAADGFMWGSIAGAVIGGTWGGTHYALQNAGKMAIKTNINNLLNNPLDDFVTIGPKDGGISSYVRSISQTGEYGNIYASKLGNGIYQIANGHHRIAALRQLGYNSVKFFLVP